VWILARVVAIALLVLALRGKRWAYVAFVAVSILYFPARVGFHFQPRACELAPGFHLAVFSLQNTAHIIIFAAFYALSWIQFRRAGWGALAWAAVATLLMGALLELAQAVTGYGHCRLRDLIPDSIGGLLAALLLSLWHLQRGRGGPSHALTT
jgi:hypothetical protein